jgi:hypothetical protein
MTDARLISSSVLNGIMSAIFYYLNAFFARINASKLTLLNYY